MERDEDVELSYISITASEQLFVPTLLLDMKHKMFTFLR